MTTRSLTTRNLTHQVAALLGAVAVIAALLVAVERPATADEPSADAKMQLVLDSSGSMKEPADGGTTKIAAAKQALNTVIDGLPGEANVGLRVYGAKVFSKSDPGACSDTQQVVPIGPVDRPALKSAVAGYKPYGETPIAHSLRQAAKDLGQDGERTILLVSDGEETCDPDPCKVAAELAKQGIDLKIDVVGLKVAGEARDQLRCIADAGRGKYYDAGSADELTQSLDKLSTRAYRPFEVSGEPVTGGTLPGNGPEIHAGQWATGIKATNDGEDVAPATYTVTKTPGSTLWIAATARPGATETKRELGVMAKAGDCQVDGSTYTDPGEEDLSPVLTANVAVDAHVEESKECAAAERVEVVLAGEITGADAEDWQVELTVDEEPAVPDVAGLPGPDDAGADVSTESEWKGAEDATDVVPGIGFSDAPRIGEGVYSSTIVPAERQIFRVKAEYGQRVRVDVHPETPGPALARELPVVDDGARGLLMYGRIYAPSRADMTAGNNVPTGGVAAEEEPQSFAYGTPQIRYLNRTGDDTRVQGSSRDGDYYLEVNAQPDQGKTYEVPYQLRVRLEGEKSGVPSYAELRTPKPSAADQPGSKPEPNETGSGGKDGKETEDSSAAADGDGLENVGWYAGGAGLLVVLTGALVLLLLRRRH